MPAAKDQLQVDDEQRKARMIGSSRLALALVFMIGFGLCYAMRVDMSVAILCMVNHTAVRQTDIVANVNSTENGTYTKLEPIINPKCIRNLSSGDSASEDGPFNWDGFVQNQILAAFFMGYPLFQIPGAFLATSFGGRWIIFGCVLSLSLATLLLPFISGHWIIVAVLRAIQGVASGAVFPASHSIISQWAPPLERSILTTVTYSGTQLGNVFTFSVSGFLCRYLSWEWVFYFWGGMGALWLILCFFFVHNKPTDHPRINASEKMYITRALGESARPKKKITLCSVPWLQFMKSIPFWAILIAHFTSDWGAYTFLSQTPRYLKSVHNFDITSNSLLSTLPYIGYWVVITASGYVADFVQQRNIMSTLWTRRVFAIFGFMLPTLLLIILGYISCEYWLLAVIILILIISTSGFQYASWVVSTVDIAPCYAGILYGICNTTSSLAGILTNSIASLFMSAQPELAEWRILFFITAGVMAFGCIFYCIFVKSEVQQWAKEENALEEEKAEAIPLNIGSQNATDDPSLSTF